MKREFSSGGVLFKGEEVLLIKNPSGVWTFPKGNIEKGETPQQAALREVEEETGVKGKILEDLGEISYWYKFRGRKIFKTVRYFLMEYLDGEPKPSWEVREARFFPAEELLKLLKYKGDIEIFNRAISTKT